MLKCCILMQIISYFLNFLDGCEKSEELRYWNSTNGPASWKFLSFNEANKLKKQIRQQELQGTQPNKNDQLIIKGIFRRIIIKNTVQ